MRSIDQQCIINIRDSKNFEFNNFFYSYQLKLDHGCFAINSFQVGEFLLQYMLYESHRTGSLFTKVA